MKPRLAAWTIAVFDLLLLLGAVLLFYPRVGLPSWISPGGDMVNLMLPARQWAMRWLAEGIVPLWNPQTFGGVPFHGAMQAAVFYPLNLAVCAFLPPLTAINLLRLAHIYLFGALTWLFLHGERRLAWPAPLLGAVAVAGSAEVASHTDHINQLAAMAWLPLLVLCQWRWWRTGSPRALMVFMVVLAVQVLAGHPQAVFYSLVLSGAIAVAWLIRLRIADCGFRKSNHKASENHVPRDSSNCAPFPPHSAIRNPQSEIHNPIRLRRTAILWFVLAVVGGFLLASIQMIPAAEASRLSRRSADDLEYALFGSMPRRLLRTAITPRAFGAECGLFVGRVTLFLAMVAVGAGIARRRPYAVFWALIVLGAFVLALGGYGPFYEPGRPSPLYRAYLWLIPPARHLRVPMRILLLATFGLAVLAAEGMSWLLRLRWGTTAVHRPVALLLAGCAVAVLALELWTFHRDEFHNQVVRYYPPEVMLSGDAREVLSPLLRLDSSRASLADFRVFRLLGRDDPDYLMDSRPEAVRNRFVRLQPNLGMLLGVAEIEGYEEGLLPPIRYFDFLNCFNRNLRSSDPDAVLLGLMNVRYLYTDANQPIESPVWRPAGQLTEPMTGRLYRLYENPLWLPRVLWADWLPTEIDTDQLRGTLSRSGTLSERMTKRQDYGVSPQWIGARKSLVAPEALATLRIRSIEPNRIVVENPTQRGGTLLVAHNPYPGWLVEAAGSAVPLQPATDFSASALVPSGSEEIRIVYRPFSFRIGAYLSGLTLIIWLTWLLVLGEVNAKREQRQFETGIIT